MGRQARFDAQGLIQHVISRGLNREAIFREPEDYEDLLFRLKYLTRETEMRVHAWSFLPNHFHLLTETGPIPLATFMRRALTGYSLYFNQKYDRVGYLFQNRYKSKLAGSEDYCRTVFVYVNRNPLKHGVVNSVRELDRYPWCGHKEIVSPGTCDLSRFQRSPFLFSNREAYYDEIVRNTQLLDGELTAGNTHPKQPSKANSSSLEAILAHIAEAHRISAHAIRGRGRTSTLSRAREDFLREAVYIHGFTLSEAAAWIGVKLPSASSALARADSREGVFTTAE